MGTNAIVRVETLARERNGEPVPVVCLALDVHDAGALRPFMREAVEKFKLQRMISPPTTDHLLVTVLGQVSAAAVKAAWREASAEDPVATFFMSRMQVADVVCGGPPQEQLSLLELPA